MQGTRLANRLQAVSGAHIHTIAVRSVSGRMHVWRDFAHMSRLIEIARGQNTRSDLRSAIRVIRRTGCYMRFTAAAIRSANAALRGAISQWCQLTSRKVLISELFLTNLLRGVARMLRHWQSFISHSASRNLRGSYLETRTRWYCQQHTFWNWRTLAVARQHYRHRYFRRFFLQLNETRVRTHVIRMSSACHPHVIRMSSTCHPHVIRMSYACHTHVIRMSSACDTHVIRMSSAYDTHGGPACV